MQTLCYGIITATRNSGRYYSLLLDFRVNLFARTSRKLLILSKRSSSEDWSLIVFWILCLFSRFSRWKVSGLIFWGFKWRCALITRQLLIRREGSSGDLSFCALFLHSRFVRFCRLWANYLRLRNFKWRSSLITLHLINACNLAFPRSSILFILHVLWYWVTDLGHAAFNLLLRTNILNSPYSLEPLIILTHLHY